MKLKVSFIAAFVFSLFFLLAGTDLSFAKATNGHATPGGSGIKPAIMPNFPGLVYRVGLSYRQC